MCFLHTHSSLNFTLSMWNQPNSKGKIYPPNWFPTFESLLFIESFTASNLWHCFPLWRGQSVHIQVMRVKSTSWCFSYKKDISPDCRSACRQKESHSKSFLKPLSQTEQHHYFQGIFKSTFWKTFACCEVLYWKQTVVVCGRDGWVIPLLSPLYYFVFTAQMKCFF